MTQVQLLGWEDLLEKELATHSSILAWRISRTEKPGRLQSMGLQRVPHKYATFTTQHNVKNKMNEFSWAFPGSPVEGVPAQSLVGELRSHMPHGVAKKKDKWIFFLWFR